MLSDPLIPCVEDIFFDLGYGSLIGLVNLLLFQIQFKLRVNRVFVAQVNASAYKEENRYEQLVEHKREHKER